MPAPPGRLASPVTTPLFVCDLALNTKDVSQLPVVGVCPEVGISLRVD